MSAPALECNLYLAIVDFTSDNASRAAANAILFTFADAF